jgi:DNA-binding transcriptional ArsR family regulator
MAIQDLFESENCARTLRAVADPERLRIIQCLRAGPLHVGELAGLLEAEMVNVSHHLGVLLHAGLVLKEKQGRFALYSLHPKVYHSAASCPDEDYLDFGCCRLGLPRRTSDD